jgi:hypothetical protein
MEVQVVYELLVATTIGTQRLEAEERLGALQASPGMRITTRTLFLSQHLTLSYTTCRWCAH